MTGTLSIGERIEAQRLIKRISRQQLADTLQVKYETIRKWENDMTMPRLSKFLAICEALECDESYLLSGKIRKRVSR
jgi:transcriptional regulator with XRE-family HTH domain